jgi:3-hydroxymyristoyl/3-hydroxydecanoyl-(acyl carrier protein) dehydratase
MSSESPPRASDSGLTTQDSGLRDGAWLRRLPHQYPFRAASAVRRIGEKTIEGVFVCTANDLLPPELMLVEAMAQFAGGLVLESQGFLFGIDRCEVTRAIEPGDTVLIEMTLEASLAGMHRFSGVGRIEGLEVVRGRFYLASPEAAHAQA